MWCASFAATDPVELHLIVPGCDPYAAGAEIVAVAAGLDLASAAPIDVHPEPPVAVAVCLDDPDGLEVAGRWMAAHAARLEFERRAAANTMWTLPDVAGHVLVISHEATRSGAPLVLLGLLRWLAEHTSLRFTIAFGRGGPLVDEFAALGPVMDAADLGTTVPHGVDLIWSNTVTNLRALNLLQRRGLPVVVHVHESEYAIARTGQEAVVTSLLDSHHIVACSTTAARMLQRLCGPALPPVTVTAPLVEPTRYDRLRSGGPFGALPWAPNPDAIVVGSLGSMAWHKGPDAFVRVAAELSRRPATRPVEFVWLGNPAPFGLEIAHDLERIGVTVPFRVPGEMADPSAVIDRFDVLLIPSREDTWPLVMLEAALLAKPMICFERTGGAPEFAAPGCGIAVPYLDTAAMADAIRLLAAHPELARAIGAAAKARVLAESTPDVVGAICAQVIAEVLSAVPASPR